MAIGELRNVPGAERWDFFVSYTAADQVWAEWIAWQLEDAGYQVLVQAWDMVVGSNWSVAMQDGIRYASRTIAVLSDAYLGSVYGRQEWQAATAADPDGMGRKLLPVRVEDCARPGLLGQVVSVDLFGLGVQDAHDRLLFAVRAAIAGRAKPASEPAFPGPAMAPIPPQAPPARSAPAFPGHSHISGRAARARHAPARPTHVDRQGFRALLVGVSGYEDERLPSLPWLPGDIGSAADALERVGYRTDVHDSSRTSASAIKAAVQAFISGATSDETLLVLLAGNGVHHDGRDYLVPSDAFVGYEPFWDLCVPIDWTAAISRSPAQNVLVLVDAGCEYGNADIRRLITGDGWGTGSIVDAGGNDMVYIFCEPSRPDARSPLTRALADVLAQDSVPDTLADLRSALTGRIGDAGTLRSIALCDPERFLPFPGSRFGDAGANTDHPWRDVANRHIVWPFVADRPMADSLQDATLALVSRLGRDRDRTAGRLESDPWTRPGLAQRMTKRVEFLLTRLDLEGESLSSAEAALLVAIPFLHEVFWARLAAEASVVRPTDLDFRARSGDPDRAEFEDFARRYPRLLRRAERAQRAGNRQPVTAIGWWLLHRWIASRPQSYQSGTLAELLDGIGIGSLVLEVFHGRWVGELLKALRAGPTFLGRAERLTMLPDTMTVGSATPDEQPLRARLVGYILAVAQRMALEPSALPDVIVEHLGVADPVDLGGLHTTIQQAEWQQRGRATRTLAAQCQHQAVQVAFEQYTKILDALLGEVHRATVDLPPLSMFPTHATAESVRAVEVDGRPLYSTAGPQFRLAEDRVQELLMGDELYDDRALAIRELYQNALDACRYRRAREEYLEQKSGERSSWVGRIEFRQGFDADGSAYIECQDNGIGMGMRELTDVFAEAGTRSIDLPEVVEEMVAWAECDPPITFFPNGRFGIGVLSYFMLANEITIDTCYVSPDGRSGDHLHVTIAGPGNLFRVQNLGPGKVGGTTVRLHLARQTGESVVSCVDILRRVLWIAEFATVAVDGGSVQHWPPDALADAAPVGDSNPMRGSIIRQTMQIVKTDSPVWWCNGQGAILSDGLWAGTATFGVVLNLTGPLAPELSVDRNSIRKLRNEEAVDALLIEAVPALLADRTFELSMEWLSDLGIKFPIVADAVLDRLRESESACWAAADGARVPISKVGCFPLDCELLQATRRPKPEMLTGAGYDNSIADFLIFKRIACWERIGKSSRIRHEDDGLMARPSDMVVLGLDIRSHFALMGNFWRWLTEHIALRKLADTLFAAGRLRRPPTEIVSRVRELGAVPPSLKGLEAMNIRSDDLVLLSYDFSGSRTHLDDTVPLGHLLAAVQHTGRTPGEVAQRFRSLGFEISPPGGTALEDPEPLDLVILSHQLDGKWPWLNQNTLTLEHLLRAALQTGRTVGDICARFGRLGYQVPPTRVISGFQLDVADSQLLVDAGWALQLQPLPLGFLIDTAAVTTREPRLIAARLRGLGFPVADTIRLPMQVESRLPEIDSVDIERRSARQVGEPVLRCETLQIAHTKSIPPGNVAAQIRQSGFVVAANPEGGRDEIIDSLRTLDDLQIRNLLGQDRIPLSEILGLAFSLGHSLERICAMLESVGVAVPDVTGIEITTDDAILLSRGIGGVDPWVRSGSGAHLMMAHVLAAAIRLRRNPSELAERVRYFGVPVADPAGWNACPVTASSLILLSKNINLSAPWIDDGPVPTVHILRAASSTGLPPREVAQTLAKLDFPIGEVLDVKLTHEDDRALDVLLDSSYPDPGPTEGTVPSRAAVLATAHRTGRDLSGIFRWMESLGISVGWDKSNITDGSADSADILMMGQGLHGEGSWLPTDSVPLGHVLAAARVLGRRPIDVAERFHTLGFHVPHSPDAAVSDLDAVDFTLLSHYLDGYAPRLASPSVPLAHILRAACVFGCEVAEIRSRYERLKFTVPDATPGITDTERAFLTVALNGADTASSASDRVSSAQLLGVAEFTRVDPAEVASHLARTGLAVASLEGLRAIQTDPISPCDALLLSAGLDSHGPWLGDSPVPLAHIIASAGYLRWTPERVARRLTDLGCVVPPLIMSAQNAFIDGVDAALVEVFRDTHGVYLDRPVSQAETLAASYRFRWTPSKIVARLIELGFSVPSSALVPHGGKPDSGN